MILPAEAHPLLFALCPAFTSPTFDRFAALLADAILTPAVAPTPTCCARSARWHKATQPPTSGPSPPPPGPASSWGCCWRTSCCTTSTTLASSDGSPSPGDAVTFTATVSAGGTLTRGQPPPLLLGGVAALLTLLAGSLHHLTVEDEGDRLAVRFGPLPLFRTGVRYEDIEGVAVGRTTALDCCGIHWARRGGWAWGLWGWECVVVRRRQGTLRIGTDDAANLALFLQSKVDLGEGLDHE